VRSALALSLLAFPLVACSGTHAQVDTGPADAAPYPDPTDGEAVTWDAWVSGFSNAYCVSCHNPNAPCGGSGCHSPDDPALYGLLFDMRQKASWTERASLIQCGIAVTQAPDASCAVPPETYPKVGNGNAMPTDTARGIVVDWFDAGCP
jgi:hypothetical protein